MTRMEYGKNVALGHLPINFTTLMNKYIIPKRLKCGGNNYLSLGKLRLSSSGEIHCTRLKSILAPAEEPLYFYLHALFHFS